MKPLLSCELWSINRWLRYTGFRLYVEVDSPGITREIAARELGLPAPEPKPTRIGVAWWGFSEPARIKGR